MGLYGKIIDLQKLEIAWDKVKKNRPASGVDDITYEDFDNNRKVELKNLNLELIEHTYEPMPVKLVKLQKEEKIREVSLYCMRDKVVQASLAYELNRIIDEQLSDCTYAYRESKSALEAISEVEQEIIEGRYQYICKTDIRNFFDNIDLDRLKNELLEYLKEADVVELIMNLLSTPSVGKQGELIEKKRGVYQGSGIAPVLSNFYLMNFDKSLDNDAYFYARFADDMLLMFDNKEEAQDVLAHITAMLNDLGLSINTDKTYIRSIEEGFDFLGYHFDNLGKSIPVKAEQRLEQNLEDVWFSMIGASLDERLVKGSQILNGWEQYYREERDIANIYEYVSVVYMVRYKPEIDFVIPLRPQYTNTHRDIAMYLISVWQENRNYNLVILEYEQLLGIYAGYHEQDDAVYMEESISLLADICTLENEELWASLMQSYADQGLFDQCELIESKRTSLKERIADDMVVELTNQLPTAQIEFDRNTLQLIDDVFFGREDSYSQEYITQDGIRKSEFIAEPLNINIIRKHLEGSITVGTYLVRSNDTVHYTVIDVDISKKALINQGKDVIEPMLQRAANETLRVKKLINDMGLKSYVEFSGYRGYHLWIFFSEWIPVKYVYVLLEIIKNRVGDMSEDITLETFPMRNRKASGRSGQNIKIPMGLHLISGKRSELLEDDFTPVQNVNEYLDGLAKYSIENVKRVIGGYISNTNPKNSFRDVSEIVIDYDKLGPQPDSIMDVIRGCSLMRYLVDKSMKMGYLTHFERLTILNVFGHLGDEGKEFVHTVMKYTINYKYATTEYFVHRMFEKPTSCFKLRDQYKQISAEFGCSCKFKRTKDCYPSPVMHALRDNDENNHEITIPISKSLPKAKKDELYQELNSTKRLEELSSQIIQLNKQKRGIEKSIQQVEKELSKIFDAENTDSMELEIGILVRKRDENGNYDWFIDI